VNSSGSVRVPSGSREEVLDADGEGERGGEGDGGEFLGWLS